MIMRVKNTPMDSTWALFWKVVFMPLPAPRCSGGRLFMTPARLGDAKVPEPSPLSRRIAAKAG